ncbi:hypothetical protein BDV19DRAFT_394107 [Aspergillus venezuelensis]
MSLIRTRGQQLDRLKDDLKEKLKLAAWVYCACNQNHATFSRFIDSVVRDDFGDMVVTKEVNHLLNTAISTSKKDDWKFFFECPDPVTEDKCRKDERPMPNKPTKEREFELSFAKSLSLFATLSSNGFLAKVLCAFSALSGTCRPSPRMSHLVTVAKVILLPSKSACLRLLRPRLVRSLRTEDF